MRSALLVCISVVLGWITPRTDYTARKWAGEARPHFEGMSYVQKLLYFEYRSILVISMVSPQYTSSISRATYQYIWKYNVIIVIKWIFKGSLYWRTDGTQQYTFWWAVRQLVGVRWSELILWTFDTLRPQLRRSPAQRLLMFLAVYGQGFCVPCISSSSGSSHGLLHLWRGVEPCLTNDFVFFRESYRNWIWECWSVRTSTTTHAFLVVSARCY